MTTYKAFLDSVEGGELRFDTINEQTEELIVLEIVDPTRWAHLGLQESEWYRLTETLDGVETRAYPDITSGDHTTIQVKIVSL